MWRAIPGFEQLWEAVGDRGGVPLRSVAFRLADGRLGLLSPIKGLGPDAHAALCKLGAPALLVAPNHYHHLGLEEYAAAYPDAAIIATASAAPRVHARLHPPVPRRLSPSGLRSASPRCARASRACVADETRLREALPPDLALLVPPGTKNGELWLSATGARGRAWIVGDGFFNLSRVSLSPLGLLVRALGIGPGLRIGTSFRWLLRDVPAYTSWLLARIAQERPTTLVPCHGEILTDAALPERLEALVRKRLYQ